MFGFGRQLLSPKLLGPAPLARTARALRSVSTPPFPTTSAAACLVASQVVPDLHVESLSPEFSFSQEFGRNFPSFQEIKSILHEDLSPTPSIPVPPHLHGCTVLNLGCGRGANAFVMSALVGLDGVVLAVDKSTENVNKANDLKEYHKDLFGHKVSNIQFFDGEYNTLPFASNSMDVIVFDNLLGGPSETALQFLAECYRVLREGGELFFSNGFSKMRIPSYLQSDNSLWDESIPNAIYFEDARRLLNRVGFIDIRIVQDAKISSTNIETESKMRRIGLCTKTIRTFKLSSLEDRLEDFGQEATYLGTIGGQESVFVLDEDHVFVPGRPVHVSGNTAEMLTNTRYAEHFSVTPPGEHEGIFELQLNIF